VNVLITGGTGFIGSRLALNCLKNGEHVTIFGQENTEAESLNRKLVENAGASVILGSVTDRSTIFEIMRDIDIVYHLAAIQHEMNVPDQKFWDINVAGTKNVLEASVKGDIKRYIHGSTIGVYGTALEGKLNEQSPTQPDNIYGITKLEGEKLALSFQTKIPVVVVRISETYGPGDRRLLKLFKGIKNKTFFMIGDGKNLHHPIYIDDLVHGLSLAASIEGLSGKTFVLPGKEIVTTNQMVDTIAHEFGTKIPRFRAPLSLFIFLATIMELSLRPIGVQPPLHRRRMDFFTKSFIFSMEQSSKLLGFTPHVKFQEGVNYVAKWYTEMGYL
jgi:dihydroflavonol-4-reductase